LDLSPPDLHRTWVEISLENMAHNVREYRRILGEDVRIMAVVKADAYGHGAPEVSHALLEAGVNYLGVAFFEEAVELRKAGIEAPIMLMGYTSPSHVDLVLEYRLTPTVFSVEVARALSCEATRRGVTVPVHVKVDTGMGRVGFLPHEASGCMKEISELPGLHVEGVMTHLSSADEEALDYTSRQMEIFRSFLEQCREMGIHPYLVHAANSAAAVRLEESQGNMVRLGLSLYGHYPSLAVSSLNTVSLKPALEFKSRVINVKKVPPGTCISYGCAYCTGDEEVIATVPAGYADGFNRLLSNRGEVLVKGKRVPVVGKVCMDFFMVKVTGIEGVEVGDEVVMYGKQREEEITVDEVAGLLDTIPYEVLCAINKRVPRLYYRNGSLVAYTDLLGKKAVHDKINKL